jgi:hypothetical protein
MLLHSIEYFLHVAVAYDKPSGVEMEYDAIAFGNIRIEMKYCA